jgi:hypothetical protein
MDGNEIAVCSVLGSYTLYAIYDIIKDFKLNKKNLKEKLENPTSPGEYFKLDKKFKDIGYISMNEFESNPFFK